VIRLSWNSWTERRIFLTKSLTRIVTGDTKNVFFIYFFIYAASRRYTFSAIFLFLFLISTRSGNNEPKSGNIMNIKVKK